MLKFPFSCDTHPFGHLLTERRNEGKSMALSINNFTQLGGTAKRYGRIQATSLRVY
jgi:hypothetical protein